MHHPAVREAALRRGVRLSTLVILGASRLAAADCPPEHAAMGHCTPAPALHVNARVAVIAATYRSPLFEGAYQGTELGASVARGRFAGGASLTGYHLVRNGLGTDGLGDVMLHAHAQLAARGRLAGGAMLMTSLPTGDADRGFGMGHVMVMPELWGTWTSRAVSASLAAGYGHAIGGAAAHAAHGGGGGWPLVAPMNAREVTLGGDVMYVLAPALGVGVGVDAAAPVGDGVARLAAGGRVVWTAGRVVTTAEVAGGVVGDPFGLRAVIGAAIRVR
jgi:hypothetical protein